MGTESERPRQKPLPCSANLLSHQVTQLRKGLAKATDNANLAGTGTENAINQLKLALRALDQALVLLANEEGNHVVSTREPSEEQADRKSLTAIDRAKIFQRWEASRWQEKHGKQQSQISVKRKLDEWADLSLRNVFVPQTSYQRRGQNDWSTEGLSCQLSTTPLSLFGFDTK